MPIGISSDQGYQPAGFLKGIKSNRAVCWILGHVRVVFSLFKKNFFFFFFIVFSFLNEESDHSVEVSL